jgi:hypothetical protein
MKINHSHLFKFLGVVIGTRRRGDGERGVSAILITTEGGRHAVGEADGGFNEASIMEYKGEKAHEWMQWGLGAGPTTGIQVMDSRGLHGGASEGK